MPLDGLDALIADALISHSVNLLRLSGGYEKAVLLLLTELEKDLIGKLSSGTELTTYSRQRLQDYLAEARSAIARAYIAVRDETDLRGVADLESRFTKQTLERAGLATVLDVALPSDATLKALVSDLLIQGAPSASWWERQAGDTAFRFAQSVRFGIAQGETNAQIVQRLRGKRGGPSGFMEVSVRNAQALVRSSVQTVANGARMATYKENADVIEGLRQLSTLDGRTTDICIAYSGAEWDLEGHKINGTKLDFNGGPPRHWNAIPAGEMVLSSSGYKPIELVGVGELVMTHLGRWRPVTATMSKQCDDGVVLVADLDSGGVLRATKEHPVLTANRGWIRMDELAIGDELFQHPAEPVPVGSLSVVVWAAQNYPACFDEEDVFELVSLSPRGMPSAVELNDKAVLRDGNVADVRTNDELSLMLDSGSGKDAGELCFTARIHGELSSDRGINPSFYSGSKARRIVGDHAPAGTGIVGVSIFGEAEGPMVGSTECTGSMSSLEGYGRGYTLSSYRDSVTLAPVGKSCFPEAKAALYGSNGLSTGVVPCGDELRNGGLVGEVDHWTIVTVTNTGSVDHNGSVYNLSVEEDETYLCGGVVVHNCRSILTPMVRPIPGLDFTPAQRATMDGPISANTTFAEWLATKPKAFQDDLLGPGRANLWRDGKMTLTQLLDQRGRPLTLAELRKKYDH